MEEYIFPFTDRPALQLQSDQVCEQLFTDFWERIASANSSWNLDLPLEKLTRVKDSAWNLDWLPTYASVLVHRELDSWYSSITLLGLDGWESVVHASTTHGRESVALPNVSKPAVFDLGRAVKDQADDLWKEFQKVLRESESNNTGNRRGHSAGHQGNQKTPSFVRVILYQTMLALRDSGDNQTQRDPIQGGTTDVGLHTGCIRRNTSFPLVLSLVHELLKMEGEKDDELFYKCVTAYFLSYLNDIGSAVKDFDVTQCNRVITIIRELETYFQKVEDDSFKETVVGVVEEHRTRLDDFRPGEDTNNLSLPLQFDQSVEKIARSLRAPKFPDIPDLSSTDDSQSRLTRARADAQRNLGYSNIASYTFTGRPQDSWVQVARLNEFFWKIATELEDKTVHYNISDLRNSLNGFSQHLSLLRTESMTTTHVMTVALSSEELVAAWICFCWAHRVAEERCPLFLQYGVALDSAELEHVVLADARALTAVDCVRQFLDARAAKTYRPFQNTKDTLALALHYGSESNRLKDIYTNELQKANHLIAARWLKIEDTQRKLSELDSKLVVAKAEFRRAETRREQSEATDYEYNRRGQLVYYSVVNIHRAEERHRQTEVENLESTIRRLETKPSNLTLGLPRSRERALQWLFFFLLPEEFRDLAALAQIAQAKLWKSPPNENTPPQNLCSWFTGHRKATIDSVSEADVRLGSHSGVPRISTPDIRHYSRETGVLFPDQLSVDPYWLGTNPFVTGRKAHETTILFTELLPQVDQKKYMEKFVAMLPSKRRENECIAWREKKPDWLTAEQYFAFANLRSGPYAQIRCLVEALHDDLLPFQHECVHILIKQLLFHVGNGWKVDLEKGWDGLVRISVELSNQARLLQDSPKDCDRALLFGVMSSFLGQTHENCKGYSREFASIFRRWADDVAKEVNSSDEMSPELYWKQAKFYGYSMMCLSFGNLDSSEAKEMAKLIILFRSKALFASSEPASSSLDQPILQVMASRIRTILDAVSSSPGCISEYLALVLDDIPANLDWSPVTYPGILETACFETVSDDHMYSVNLLNGTVLVDGVPPGTLPSSVFEDSLYKRTFGSRNFEMVILGFRHYRAARRIEDRFIYEFVIDSSDVLHILEQDSSVDDKLLLLRRDSIDLPPLLKEGHSHWFSERHGCVVLRDPSYSTRNVAYIIAQTETYRLPSKNNMLSLEAVKNKLPDCERLVLGGTELSVLLQDFEAFEYIHLYLNPTKTSLRFALPRFRLSFQQTKQSVASAEFKGFHMMKKEILKDTLPWLKASIILGHPDGRQKVLIPDGLILCQSKIDVPLGWNIVLNFHIYDIHHRFRHLVAGTTIGRLQLASLYAASGCLVADRRLGKTAGAVACELIRQSWKNEPFSKAEKSKLMEVSSHSQLFCTLRLLCTWLWTSSNSVTFLHEWEEDTTDQKLEHESAKECSELDFDILALDEYRRSVYAPRLVRQEELSLLGTLQPKETIISFRDPAKSKTLDFVHKTERTMRQTYVVEKMRVGVAHGFPLQRPSSCTGLELQVYEEMEISHRSFRRKPELHITRKLTHGSIEKLAKEVRGKRESYEISLLSSLCDRRGSLEYRLSLVSGRNNVATPLDILRIVCDGSIIDLYAPSSKLERQRDLRMQGTEWATLCVLEDKLERILRIDFKKDAHSALEELKSIREWDPTRHPRWLAFEVEQNLQIRPNQYSIVRQLLERPNSVIQLNMGLGKTRVLVPMLILESMSSKCIGRVNVLPSIINEAMEFYRNVLVASVQHVKLFSFPFHRDVALDTAIAARLTDEIKRCREHKGCFVVTAQQRNSLLLKQYDQGVFVDGLKESFQDILDESDAILHHDFQLVYALGAQVPLPAGPTRWTVLQALLTVLSRCEDEEMCCFMGDISRVHNEKSRCGSFPKIRLLLPFRGHERELGETLAKQLLACPTHELRWMKEVPKKKLGLLVKIISDPSYEKTEEAIDADDLFKENESHILAARGFVAYGLLFHGLEARYRVTYGLNPQSKTNMAVPYAASDTPKPRSQYSHPDMCIVYTALSYYHEGLTQGQLIDALLSLQSMGVTAQKAIYGEWISSVRTDVPPRELEKFDDPNKVDVNNSVQFELVFKNLRFCMEVISFWTNNSVYPMDTFQFPSKRGTSAWHVCDSGSVIGFSGTDDNRFLLPLSVSQIPPDEEPLRATNAEMIKLVIDCTKRIHLLEDASSGYSSMWHHVLSECVALGVDALIDVAGLMAGSSNDEVAHFVAERLDQSRFRGVVYFHAETNAWKVYETENHRSIELRSSSFTEAECFVYFDESRCRGSDMKLHTNAVAMVTLEPKITKDKFLQGCARMRKLRIDSQSLILAGTSEVVRADSTTKEVLEKILHHTAETTKHGVFTFCQRGVDYYSFLSPSDDDFSLQTMYAKNIPQHSSLTEFLDALYGRENLADDARRVVEYCKNIGGGLPAGAHRFSEECEQELEHEIEYEEEKELSIARQDPHTQGDWEFDRAFSDPESFFKKGFFLRVVDFIRDKVHSLAEIGWSENLFCTPNFLKTIQEPAADTDLSRYLRPVNGMLVTQDGRIVLLSGYEFNALLPFWWTTRRTRAGPKASLQQLFTCVSGCGFGHDSVSIPEEAMASVKLFRGLVQYTKKEQQILSKAFDNVHEANLVVQELLSMRSRLGHYERSDLEAITTRFFG